MRVSLNQKGYTLSNLTAGELKTIMYLLGTIKDRCFKTDPERNGDYYSGDGFIAVLNEKEFKDFHRFVDGFWNGYQQRLIKF